MMGRVMGEPRFCRRGRIWRDVGSPGCGSGGFGAGVSSAVDWAASVGQLRRVFYEILLIEPA